MTHHQNDQPNLDDRYKELIAIGASVAGHCQPCLTYHVSKAKELDISEDLIREAISIGQMVERGAMSAMREFSNDIAGGPGRKSSSCCGGAPAGGGRCC